MPSVLLERYGTKLMELKPSSIWAAAMADMDRKVRNASLSRAFGDYEQYAFHRDHVAKADTANDLIRLAIIVSRPRAGLRQEDDPADLCRRRAAEARPEVN